MKNILIAGVGGQGVILASKVIMEAALRAGLDVKESEVHGMAQRGGSVECHVRYGEKVYSPLIQKGKADYIVSFEMLEGLRKLEYLAPEGMLLVNSLTIDPAPVKTGQMTYPTDIEEWTKKNVPNQLFIDTSDILKEVGNKKTVNIVMLGVLSRYLEFDKELWHQALRAQVRENLLEMNIKAFDLGRGE